MAFVLANDPFGNAALGNTGGSLGAGGMRNGLAIQFDTYQNANQGDIAAPHTGIVTTDPLAGTYRLSNQIALNNLTDGNWHTVNVSWAPMVSGQPSGGVLTYTFDGVQVGHLQLTATQFSQLLRRLQLCYFGFTGRPAAQVRRTRSSSIRSTQASKRGCPLALRIPMTGAFLTSHQSVSI